jgi:hypothetical protein
VLRNQLYDEQASRSRPIQDSSSLSSSVFGYGINYDTFKRESYFNMLLSDRLEPYLAKAVPRHRSISINTPVPVYY